MKNVRLLCVINFFAITMQNMTFALGLRCIDCHDVSSLALDTKP